MRIIKKAVLADYWGRNPQAETGLAHWYKAVRRVEWQCFPEVRATFPHADQVTVGSGRRVVVFNVGGNKYRLVTAIHYNRQLVFTLMVLTHAEYDRDEWKDIL
jgi:mRNA interferase HigB